MLQWSNFLREYKSLSLPLHMKEVQLQFKRFMRSGLGGFWPLEIWEGKSVQSPGSVSSLGDLSYEAWLELGSCTTSSSSTCYHPDFLRWFIQWLVNHHQLPRYVVPCAFVCILGWFINCRLDSMAIKQMKRNAWGAWIIVFVDIN